MRLYHYRHSKNNYLNTKYVSPTLYYKTGHVLTLVLFKIYNALTIKINSSEGIR